MGERRKSGSLYLYFAILCIASVVLFSHDTMTAKAAGTDTYLIIFETNGGECELETVNVEKGQSLILPPATFEGHYLKGWMERIINDDGSYTFQVWPVGSSYTPKKDDWLYAVWGEEITVTFEAGMGECTQTEITVNDNEEITLPDASCEGYDFTGWYKDENRQEYAGGAGEGYAPGKSMTLYAGWVEIEKPKFTITFNAGNGECGETTVLVEQGAAVTLPEATREGYDFTGWYKDEGCNEYAGAAGEDYIPDGDNGLYAGWKAVENGGMGEEDNSGNPPAGPETKGAGSEEKADGGSENKVFYLAPAVNSDIGYAEAKDKENGEDTGSAEEKLSNNPAAENTVSVQAEEAGVQEDTGKAVEPVIQTGRISLAPAAVVIGLYGALLVAAAWMPGKKKRDEKK